MEIFTSSETIVIVSTLVSLRQCMRKENVSEFIFVVLKIDPE